MVETPYVIFHFTGNQSNSNSNTNTNHNQYNIFFRTTLYKSFITMIFQNNHMTQIDDENYNYRKFSFQMSRGWVLDNSLAVREAESGDIQAQLYLGNDADNHMKAYWFKKAAIQGHPEAMCSLAALYEFGLAIKMNLKKACEWYEKYLKNDRIVKDPQSLENALYRYGSYLLGEKAHGLSEKYTARSQALPSGLQDPKKGVLLLERAGEEFNCLPAIKMLAFGIYTMSGKDYDVKKDLDKGMYWYLKGAQNGDGNSAFQLAIIFMSGSVPNHRGLKLKWLDIGAKLGWPDAIRCMNNPKYTSNRTLDRDVARKRLRHIDKEKNIEQYLATDSRNLCSNPKCENVEEEGVRFNVCAKCRQKKYCSRDCQVTHWGEGHKQDCVRLREGKEQIKSYNRNAARLDARICFNPKCSRLEREDEKFELCCDCKNALYCSEDCHRQHYKNGHEDDCKRTVYYEEGADKLLLKLSQKINSTDTAIANAAAEGADAAANGANAVAEGADAAANGANAVAEGADAAVNDANAVAEGADATANGVNAVAGVDADDDIVVADDLNFDIDE